MATVRGEGRSEVKEVTEFANAGTWTDLVNEGYASDSSEDAAREGRDAAEILKEILPFIEMAKEAYEDTNMSQRIDMVAKSKLVRGKEKDTEVHVCILKDGSVVFAFRGTETSSIKDVLTDIDVKQDIIKLYQENGRMVYKSTAKIKAHKGFQAALKNVTDGTDGVSLVHALRQLGMDAGDVKRVICVGHSLGGALATLCAMWCRKVAFLRAEIGCVTIGSPRVGNEAFAAEFNSQVVSHGMMSYRVVNKRDVVAFLPPKSLLFPYKHVSNLIHMREDEQGQTRATLEISGQSLFILCPQDHFRTSYLASINAVLELAALTQPKGKGKKRGYQTIRKLTTGKDNKRARR